MASEYQDENPKKPPPENKEEAPIDRENKRMIDRMIADLKKALGRD